MVHTRDALWETGHDESVEVNQRALIDKVLARYSGEFTVFRELLQNSDDAQSKAVEIRFETQSYTDRSSQTQGSEAADAGKKELPDLKTTPVHHWIFKNNGILFRDQDWSRLKKIAEGNPDEEKIGAFGVGFYSLFSITEEPFVKSGDQWMGFYWKDKKDQLYARRGTFPAVEGSLNSWTSFEMALREAAPIPGAFDFTRFVASSITFMTHLSEVSIYFDDKRLAKLTKATGVPRSLEIPKGLKRSSASNIMNATGIKSTPLHIKADVMRWVYAAGTTKKKPPPTVTRPNKSSNSGFLSAFSSFFSTSGASTPQRVVTPLPAEPAVEIDPLTVTETQVTLSIFSADVDVRLSEKMSAELHRSTKKNPPSKLTFELIYTTKDEYDASIKEDEKQPFVTGSVFQGLRADLDGSGSARIFIGHATAQTTGIGGHMAARFIPTVERESIDLVDRTVAMWNKELLYIGGFLARAVYELELDNSRALWQGAMANGSPKSELQSWLCGRALHALKFFTFQPSTPSSDVSAALEAAFFACSSPSSFPIMSTAGVRIATEVRFPDPTFSAFVKQLAVLPDEVLMEAKRMVTTLQARGMIKDIKWPDILDELRKRPLLEEEMIACLKWWIGLHKQGGTPDLLRIRTDLLNAAVLVMDTSSEGILPLNNVQTFLNMRNMGSLVPVNDGAPLPKHLLPLNVSRHFDPVDLQSSFPWRELSIIDWLQHVINPEVTSADVQHDITRSASWAERVFLVLARGWPSLSKADQNDICVLLNYKTCVPTSSGFKRPDESYLQNANVFKDLPIVTLPSGTIIKGQLEKIFTAMGVRKHVELQIVFDRMIKTGDWTVADLIKYLVNVQTTLSAAEIEKLQATSAFVKEGDVQKTRFRALDLYEPLDNLRQLGLPIIDWGTSTKWRSASEEAKFLYKLGLRRSPPLKTIISLCASNDPQIRPLALKYFLNNHAGRYSDFDPSDFPDVPFVPALDQTTPQMGKHKEVFSSPEWASFGFLIAHPSLNADALTKLKIKDRPESSALVTVLSNIPPKDEATAQQWFGVLAGHVSDFSLMELKRLSEMPIVPTKHTPRIGKEAQISGRRWLPPSQCYFAGDSRAQFHSKLFSFVDFGSRANNFLRACGTKNEPSVEEVSRILLDNPHRFYELADGRDNFLIELRNIAVNRRQISSTTLTRMKKAPILLASQRKRHQTTEKGHSQSNSTDLDEDDWDLQYDLRRADQIVIVDDNNGYQIFGDQIFTAPQEDIIESFYTELGSRRLSSLIREDYKTSSEIKNSKVATETRYLILERLPLFLHEHTYSRSRITYRWLTEEKNFLVKTFGKLTVAKSLSYGDVRLSRSQESSAAARRLGYGPIELWLAGHSQVDMYEVATSLCRLLFEAPKVNDALLLMTILSTDLKSLKRRGYNVDRILRQQKADRQAADDAARTRAENTALISKPSPDIYSRPAPPIPKTSARPVSPPELPPPTPPKFPDSFDPDKSSSSSLDLVKSGPRPGAAIITNWKRKLGIDLHRPEGGGSGPSLPVPNGTAAGMNASPGPAGNIPSSGRRPNTSAVTPQSNISSNIEMAIKACTQEQGHLLRNRDHMQMVKESLDEGYCDISGRVGDLDLAGEMGGVNIFVSRDTPQLQSIITTKHDVIARFIHVITPLGQIYKLPLTSLHIFYDQGGDLIAFNRKASIFLNLRYFEAWHDADVLSGNLSSAYISWFFTLAHEIAHNLIQPHNSEHEFYFSAICEAHIVPFGKLLG